MKSQGRRIKLERIVTDVEDLGPLILIVVVVTDTLDPQLHQESVIIAEDEMIIVLVAHLLLEDTDEIDLQIIMMAAVGADLALHMDETRASEIADVMNLKTTCLYLEGHLEMYQRYK